MKAINFYDLDMENYNQNIAAEINPMITAEQAARDQKLFRNGWLVLGILVLVFGIFSYQIIQEDLNKSWRDIVESE